MRRVYAKHMPYEDGHLGEVANDMVHYGPPTIRVMLWRGAYFALEGSHRLAVAHYKKIAPKLVVEVEEVENLPSGHYEKIADTLPIYDFEGVSVLDLNVFLSDKYATAQ